MIFFRIYLTYNLWASWSGLTYLLHYTFKVTWFVTQTSSGVTVTYCKISIKLSSAFKPMFILQYRPLKILKIEMRESEFTI